MLVIAIDYDDTYTADPELWDMFIKSAQEKGHYVFIATFRGEDDPIENPNGLEVAYCNRKPKLHAVRELGLPEPSIWIDDWPWLIGMPDEMREKYGPGSTTQTRSA